jgi:hypothetical protein
MYASPIPHSCRHSSILVARPTIVRRTSCWVHFDVDGVAGASCYHESILNVDRSTI